MAGSDMSMILILGVVVIGGFFLLQSGGLSNLLQPAAPPAEDTGDTGEDTGDQGDMGDEYGDDQGGYGGGPGGGMGGMGYPQPYPVPVPTPVPVPFPRPGPHRSPPFVPRPRPGPGPPMNPCSKYCFPGPFYNPPKCRMCKDALGKPVHAFPGNAYRYGQTGMNTHPNPMAIQRAGSHSRAFYGRGCGCS